MAIIARAAGGADVLEWAERAVEMPASGEVLVRHTAIGVNFIDCYYRSGLYPWPQTPLVPGAEAAGVVEAVGSGVSDFSLGDRVVYTVPTGAYCQSRVIAAQKLVKLPDAISDRLAASIMLKGLTVEYLVNSSFKAQAGQTVLVHAAAGGVGLLLGQWLNSLGVTVIGTVSTQAKAEIALANGYHHIINYRTEDFVARIAELTKGAGCHAVYDSVGKDTWRGSLQCLRPLGTFVNFGQSSGPIEGFSLADLAKGSFTAIRPVLFHYISDPVVLAQRAALLFHKFENGALQSQTNQTFALQNAADAHRLLESRASTGALILIP